MNNFRNNFCLNGCFAVTGTAEKVTATTARVINNQFSGACAAVCSAGLQYSANGTKWLKIEAPEESPFSVLLTGLSPRTTYFFRAVVSTCQMSSCGVRRSFTTAEEPPAFA